jgi:hypothetical protein
MHLGARILGGVRTPRSCSHACRAGAVRLRQIAAPAVIQRLQEHPEIVDAPNIVGAPSFAQDPLLNPTQLEDDGIGDSRDCFEARRLPGEQL